MEATKIVPAPVRLTLDSQTRIESRAERSLTPKAQQYAALQAAYVAQLTGSAPKTNPTHPVWR